MPVMFWIWVSNPSPSLTSPDAPSHAHSVVDHSSSRCFCSPLCPLKSRWLGTLDFQPVKRRKEFVHARACETKQPQHPTHNQQTTTSPHASTVKHRRRLTLILAVSRPSLSALGPGRCDQPLPYTV